MAGGRGGGISTSAPVAGVEEFAFADPVARVEEFDFGPVESCARARQRDNFETKQKVDIDRLRLTLSNQSKEFAKMHLAEGQ